MLPPSLSSPFRQIVGIMAACERFLTDAEDRNIDFMVRLYQKQLQRLTVSLDQFIVHRVSLPLPAFLLRQLTYLLLIPCRRVKSSPLRELRSRSKSGREWLPSSSTSPCVPPFRFSLVDRLAYFLPFPQVFIDLFESQLIGTDGLEIRSTVDASYEKIANAMFESLQQLAKMDGAEGLAPEDKGQLNYHVILIGQ